MGFKLILLSATFVGVVALVTVALVQLFAAQTVSSAVACPAKNACTPNYLTTGGTCEVAYWPTTTACADACYTTGFCNGLGECVGDESACKATCSTDDDVFCDSTFKFDANMVAVYVQPCYPAGPYTSCYANRCSATLTFYDSERGAYPVNYITDPSGTWTTGPRCKDFLDADWFAVNGSCIEIREWQLESNWSAGFTNDIPDDTESEAWRSFHTCEYQWACGHYDAAWLDANVASLSAGESSKFTQRRRALIAERERGKRMKRGGVEMTC